MKGRFYPANEDAHSSYVGKDSGAGYNINIGWDAFGMGDMEYLAAWTRILLPIAYEYSPQLILISAGFDAAQGDPLGRCSITPEGYAHLTHQLMGICGGKTILVLEGGYNLRAISESFAACTEVILGRLPPRLDVIAPIHPAAIIAVEEAVHHLAPYWRMLGSYVQNNVDVTEKDQRPPSPPLPPRLCTKCAAINDAYSMTCEKCSTKLP